MEKYPNITDSYIRSLTDKAITYAKGKDYYEKNFITSLRESRDRHTFDAEVAGTEFYAVHLEFRGNKLAVCDCDCPHSPSMTARASTLLPRFSRCRSWRGQMQRSRKKNQRKNNPRKNPKI